MLGYCTISAYGATLKTIINGIACLVGLTIPLGIGIALIVFFWGVFQAFGKLDTVEKRVEVRSTILWSILALFIIVSLGGIIALFTSTFPDLRP